MKSDLRAMITGSFDPITLGHIDIIERASKLFPEVYVVMFINANKKYMFDEEKRLTMIKKVCRRFDNVKVDFSNGMVVDYVRDNDISLIIRGIRGDEDIAYEKLMAEYNYNNSGVETLFLPAKPCHEGISSTLVRNTLQSGKDPSDLISDEITDDILSL